MELSNKSRLGKGLGALISEKKEYIVEIDISKIIQNPAQPRKKFEDEVIAARENNTALKSELTSAQELKDQIVAQLGQAEARIKALEQKLASVGVVDLEKIVVTPAETPAQNARNEGQVLKVNAENNFVIVDLGSASGAAENTAVQFFRANTLLGEGKVTRAQTIMSAVDIVPPLTAGQLQVKDKAVIKK